MSPPAAPPEPEESARLRIRNRLGMHARAAVKFVQAAAAFDAEIFVRKDGEEVNGKSIMGLLTLVAALGTEIEVVARGPDAKEALAALVGLIGRGFDEGVVDPGDGAGGGGEDA